MGIICLGMIYSLAAIETFTQSVFARDVETASKVPGASIPNSGSESLRQNESFPRKLSNGCVPNLIQVHDRIYCGGMPRRENDFAALAELGIKVIVSVDGAKPDVESARSNSIRYVHLPCGYDAVSAQRGLQFAKAISQFDGPILFHCHHGKHRAPVAAVIGGLKSGLIDRSRADVTLRIAETDPRYLGLFAAVKSAREVDPEKLSEFQTDFRSVSPVSDLAAEMVLMQSTRDELWNACRKVEKGRNSFRKANLQAEISSHALLLKEHYAELIRRDVQQEFGREFAMLLRDSFDRASRFSFQLSNSSGDDGALDNLRYLKQALLRIDANCKTCHDRFRGR